jgi:hypothetical protein
MSPNREAKVQQILDLFESGDYRVDPAAVAGSVIRRMSLASGHPHPTGAARGAGQHRIRGIVSVERGRARVAAF